MRRPPFASRGWGARPGISRDEERGSVTLFVLVVAVGLLLMAGLVVDGGAKLRAIQRADALAAQAARAGGQQLATDELMAAGTPRVERSAAVRAAHAHLRALGVDGSVTVGDHGRTLQVSTRLSVPTVFLGVIGLHRLPATGYAEASLVHTTPGATP